MNDDPRDTPDQYAQIVAGVDQLTAEAPHVARILASEWKALREEGVGSIPSAIIVGTRWAFPQ